jgi:predicted enzyme involved in methoxymalonyl-ACP biosynthesis
MNLVVERARELGAHQLIGEYLPTKKNGMVRDHYRKLGFTRIGGDEAEASRWSLSIADYQPFTTSIAVLRSEAHG